MPYFAEECITLETGEKFSFRDHPYLFGLYKDDFRDIVVEKATQLGFTSWALIRAIHKCSYLYPLGAGYYFPTSTDVADFSRGRIKPFLKHNAFLSTGADPEDTDNVRMKALGKSFIYLRGMKTAVGLKSTPLDGVTFDEIDEASPASRDMAMKRVSHSIFKDVVQLSNPTIEEYGIDAAFLASDMRYWYLKCPHCGEWNNFEKEFPACLIRCGDTVIRACKKCRKDVPLDSPGEWVPDYPSRSKDKHGYHASQLISRFVDPKEILDELEFPTLPNNLENLYRLRLGMAHTNAQNKVTKEQILQLPRIDMKDVGRHVCFLGMDHGSDLHIAVIALIGGGKVALKELIVKKNFEDVDALIRKHKVIKGVGDALPETREMKKLCSRHEGVMFMNYYNERQKGSYRWNEIDSTVQENRTESLDSSLDIILNRLVISNEIPEADVDMFAAHCANMARIKETDEDGSQRYVWVKKGADHFRHGINYACIAASEYGDIPVSMKELKESVLKAPDLESVGADSYL